MAFKLLTESCDATAYVDEETGEGMIGKHNVDTKFSPKDVMFYQCANCGAKEYGHAPGLVVAGTLNKEDK
jgi:hypothetical protein